MVARTKLPPGTQAYRPRAPVKALKTGGPGAVVSTLSKGAHRFLVIVNRDINGPMPLAMELDGSVTVRRITKNGSLRPVARQRVDAQLEPGDVCLLTWPGREK